MFCNQKTGWWFQPTWKISVKFDNFPQVGVKIKNIWVPTTEKISVPCFKKQRHITKTAALKPYSHKRPSVFWGQLLNHPEKANPFAFQPRWSFLRESIPVILHQFYLVEPIFFLRGEVPGPYEKCDQKKTWGMPWMKMITSGQNQVVDFGNDGELHLQVWKQGLKQWSSRSF